MLMIFMVYNGIGKPLRAQQTGRGRQAFWSRQGYPSYNRNFRKIISGFMSLKKLIMKILL